MLTRMGPRRPRRLLSLMLALTLVGGIAFAYWSAGSAPGGNGAAAATSVSQGATPTTSAANGASTVVVTWVARTLATGQAVSGYQVNRYPTGSSTAQTMLSACIGTINALTCTESNVPTGAWQYTVTPVFASNWRGLESAKSATVTVDATAPTNNITLSGITGNAHKSGTTVYYRGQNAGSLTLTNAVADSGTGPASSQTAALGGTSTGWTHTPSTVSSPAGGPYVSNTFSWAPGSTSGPTEVVTGRDGAGNTVATTLTFVNDSSAPSTGFISYTNGYTSIRSVVVTFTAGTDSGSGVDPTGGRIKRSVATLNNGVCGTYTTNNTFVVNPTSPYTDTSVSSGNCYTYQYVTTDNLGSTSFASSASVAMVDYAGAVNATTGLLSQWRFGEAPIASSDTFADTTGTLLSAHTSSTGTTWTQQAGSSTTAQVSATGTLRRTGQGVGVYYTPAVPLTPDYLVEADVVYKSLIANDFVGVAGRLDTAGTSGGTFYTARYDANAAQWQLNKAANGAVSSIATAHAQTLTVGQTYRLGLEMSGSTISLLVDGVVRVSATDATLTAAGRAGVRLNNTVAGATSSDTTGLHLDNFEVSPPAVDSKGSNTGDYRKGVQLGSTGAIAADANTSATFDGANDHMRAPTTGLPTGAAARSVEAWFKTSGVASGQVRQALFSYGTNTLGQEFGAWLESDGVRIKADGGGTSDRTFTFANFNDNQWHHFVETYDGTEVRMYVDGVLGTGTRTVTLNTVVNSSYDFTVGAVPDSSRGALATQSFFNGSLDEVSFYTTALSSTTVTNHFQLGDSGGPTGGSVEASGLVGTGSRYSPSTTLSLVLAKGTDPSGVATAGNTLSRASSTLTSGTCGTFGTYTLITGGYDPVSPKTDTVADGACYSYRFVVADTFGNTTTYTSGDIKVDTTVPSAPTLAYSALSNVSATGNTLYFRPGAASGSFTITATSTDPTAGIASYAFPSFGSGWTSTPGALGVNTYAWTGANTATGGSPAVTATNNAATTSAASTIAVTADSTAPTAGTITYADGSTTNTTVSVAFTTGSDSGSGLANRLLQRASATYDGTTCAALGSFATIATDTASPFVDTVVRGNCYTYQYVVSDNVGNTTTATSTNVVKVSQTYATTVSATSGLLNWFRLGELQSSKDTFTDTSGTLLSAHSPDLGTSWTRWVNDTITATMTNADALRKSSSSGGVGYYTGVAPVSPDYLVEADVVVKSVRPSDTIGVVGRWRTTQVGGAGTNYIARYNTDTAAWELVKAVNGTGTLLGSFAQTLTAGTTYRLGLDMNGTTIRLLVDTVQRVAVTDAAVDVAGRAGVRLGKSTDTATQSDTTGLHLDDFNVSPPLADSKGTNDGDYFGGVPLGIVGAIAGDADTAATFDGLNDYGSVTRTIQDDFSIELWFKSTQGIGTGAQWWNGAGMVDAELNGAFNDFGVSLRSDGRVVAGVGTPDVSIVSATGGYNNGAWHHVVFTRTKASGAMQLYVDGTSAGTATGSTLSLTSPASINFGRLLNGTNPFAGSLDEVAVYNVTLPQTTVTSHFNAGQ